LTATLALLLALFTQAATPALSEPDAKTRAQALLGDGTVLYEHGDFAGALAKFQAAYAIYPSPNLQFNIGQADRELERPVEAIEAFERFLAQVTKAAPELLSEANQSLADLRSKLGRIKIVCETPDAEVAIDGKTVGSTPLAQPVWALPGRHKVMIRHAGYKPITVTVAAGEHETVVFESHLSGVPGIGATAQAGNVSPPSLAAAAPSVAERGSDQDWFSRQRWYVWATAGATVAFTGASIVSALSANSMWDNLNGSCGVTKGCTPNQVDSLRSRATLTNVLLAFAGVSAVATGVSLYVGNRDAVVTLAWRF
jgi:hypothetical protein